MWLLDCKKDYAFYEIIKGMQKKSAVLRFIDQERAKGTSDKEIQHQLLDAGWHMDIIQNAMHSKQSSQLLETSNTRKKKEINAARVLNPYIWAAVFVALVLFALFI